MPLFKWPKRQRMPWKVYRFCSPDLPYAEDRQDRLRGYSTELLRQLHVLMIGAGGLGSSIVPGLVRKGVGQIHLCDADTVGISNLNRQDFTVTDFGKCKAICLARNAARQGALGSRTVGHCTDFTSETAERLVQGAQIVICGVDNNLARKLASELCRERRIPCVLMAVNEGADHAWVFVQEPDGPCVACVFPFIAAADSDRERCIANPAIIDILKVVGGFALYAVDSLVMPHVRVRHWNYRSINLRGGVPDEIVQVERRVNCPMCGVK
jgi:molybdopterin/thiamine biosynthesis adenylyltransferase